MTTEFERVPHDKLPSNTSLVSSLPKGAVIQQIAFVSESSARQEVLLRFPEPIQRLAVLVDSGSEPQAVGAGDLSILMVPAEARDAINGAESELVLKMREWVDAAAHAGDEPASLLMTFQGAQICWKRGRCAVSAPPERLDAVRRALVEVSFYEAELRDIERELGEAWPQLEADMPLAFQVEENSIGRRNQLRQRFQQVLKSRARLARIGPHVHCPHLHPPTLASQIGERLRERMRMVHRHESLGEQLEVFERVYDMCGERVSNFLLTRSGNLLEWIIILLLLTQLLLTGFELLTSTGGP